ncbi:MAG: alkaline ceramidase [Pirellulales bacterium]
MARVDITPPVGIYCRNWGAAKHDVARGIHRPLSLTALAIAGSPGEVPLVLLDADLGWWASAAHEREFRRGILDALELPAERLLFAVTHTHAAPPLSRPEPHWAGGDLLAAYHATIQQAAIRVAREAIGRLELATLEWHVGSCRLAANRDLPERLVASQAASASPRVVCGYNPDGPADHTLLVGRITAAGGRPLATLVNYACHPTTLAWENDLVSPDYVGAMRETIEAATAGAPAVFLQGASGELAPRHQYVGDPAVADAHGRELGHAVIATLQAMEPPGERLVFDRVVESGAPLAVWRREQRVAEPGATALAARRTVVDLPLKQWPTAAELVTEIAACSDRALAERLRRRLRIREALGDGATYPFEIWGWRAGEAVVLGTMAEAYSRIQRRLRSAFPDWAVVWLNLVNGGVGYLPPADLYDIDVYPAWQTPFDRGSLELVEEAALALGRELLAS